MTNYEFEVGQRVEIHGLPDFSADCIYNGMQATVVSLPGFHPRAKTAYAVLIDNVGIELAIDTYLRHAPPKDRKDCDKVVSWAVFDAMTGLRSILFRRSNPDY
jgi:hypothetical protein